jgi:hypothetical protein
LFGVHSVHGDMAKRKRTRISALGAIAGGVVADRFDYESVNLFAAAGALLSLLCGLPLRNRGLSDK